MSIRPFATECWALSDIGLKRLNNEDVFAMIKDQHFYALADGMGGHQAGEVAAKLAIEKMCDTFTSSLKDLLPSREREDLLIKLADSMQEANAHVFQMASTHRELSGMGTTLSCLFLHEHFLFFAHVGDSRIYRFRGNLEQLTEDHSLRKEFPSISKNKHKLTRAIGTSLFVDPEIGMAQLHPDDFYLLCSDGLTDHVSDEVISNLFLEQLPPPILCQALVDAAKEDGGYDNITVVAIKILDRELES